MDIIMILTNRGYVDILDIPGRLITSFLDINISFRDTLIMLNTLTRRVNLVVHHTQIHEPGARNHMVK
jgi:hypothetical protein